MERVIHRPHGALLLTLWLAGTLAAATVAAMLFERLGRRFLPLVGLLDLTMLFPDAAPSRYKIARAAGNPAALARLASDSRDARSASAAEVLSLITEVGRHDKLTRGHSERVRVFSDLIAEEMGIEGPDRDKLRWGALLHDVGKLDVPAEILTKKGRPTPEEWAVLQSHPLAGEVRSGSLYDWLGDWSSAITQHHERFDGGGYPHGLSGEAIGLGGRIVAVADCYETMTATRSYKKPMSPAAARQELIDNAGSQFDPEVVRAFLLISVSRMARTSGPLAWLLHLPFSNIVQTLAGKAGSGASIVPASFGAGALAATAVAFSAPPAATPLPSAPVPVASHVTAAAVIPTFTSPVALPVAPVPVAVVKTPKPVIKRPRPILPSPTSIAVRQPVRPTPATTPPVTAGVQPVSPPPATSASPVSVKKDKKGKKGKLDDKNSVSNQGPSTAKEKHKGKD